MFEVKIHKNKLKAHFYDVFKVDHIGLVSKDIVDLIKILIVFI